MYSKCPPPARMQARRRWRHSPTCSTFNNRVTQSGPLAVDASFQFVDVRDLGAVDSLLKHTPHGVVNRVEVRWVRRPESRWDKIGRLLIQQRYSVFGAMWWGTVLLKNKKLASRCCTNVRKQHLSQNDVTIVRLIDLDPWFEDVNVTGTQQL